MLRVSGVKKGFWIMSFAVVLMNIAGCEPSLNRRVNRLGGGSETILLPTPTQEKCEGNVAICGFSYANRGRLVFAWQTPANNENSFLIRFCQDQEDCATDVGGTILHHIQCNGNTCYATVDNSEAILVSVIGSGARKTFNFADNQLEWVLDPGNYFEIKALTSSGGDSGFIKGNYLNN